MRYPDRLSRELAQPAFRKAYQQEKLILDITELISEAMERRGFSKAELARKLGKDRAVITRMLSGDTNLTLRTAADAMTSMGYELVVDAQPIAQQFSLVWDVTAAPIKAISTEPPAEHEPGAKYSDEFAA